MNPAAAIALAAVLIIAAIWATYLAATWEKPHGQHARAFTDPADVTDPDGAQFIAELHHEPLPLSVLARVRDGLLRMPGRQLDDTGPIPHAVGTWGMTVTQVLDELEATYMEVKR